MKEAELNDLKKKRLNSPRLYKEGDHCSHRGLAVGVGEGTLVLLSFCTHKGPSLSWCGVWMDVQAQETAYHEAEFMETCSGWL